MFRGKTKSKSWLESARGFRPGLGNTQGLAVKDQVKRKRALQTCNPAEG